ncbi:MAG: Crp/Fnr family transcriptional regulator [Tabrizicola sp.]|uniref:Crp/Fnr family transcriptional regulator n=1 Tax=Tabrizicola sp. TaxID=2005166 RepID=UPI00273231EB|nr:Crp/Fnr family transcriptional regulator [Tabrizicola sp.]MDP3264585.1 Crp/Fnr family transcriptional regulator [Tabrizicola sp.]MDP3647735.1 Crp/Fnr family transcriptional regulator [Paracoccaceae bacterium]MDZ4067362.1 Crp/Fnr family transcriptional regulator [Tabrizicola sp.]
MHKLDESLLAGIPPFRKLERAQIREILDAAQALRFDGGVAVFSEGMPVERFFLLLDGHIRVVRTTPGGEQIIALHISPGQLFGIGAAIGRTTYPATAMTADDCVALAWPNRLWPVFVENYEGFATETYKVVGERVGEMNNRIVEMATQQVEQRIANAILRLVTQTGRKVEGGIEIGMPITRQNLSDMTGSTLHTVSRLLSGWERDGIVLSERRKITVTAPHRLVMLSGAAG